MFQFENIPDELKKLKQWVVWRYEDRQARKPLKMPYCLRTGTPARVNELADCTDYVTAVAGYSAMSTVYDGIGFVFSASDPYAFIDLDDPESDDDIKQKQIAIYEQFVSYAEISVNGGLHIIVRGSVPCGRKRTAIEVYSDRRFAVMTGNVYRQAPIVDYQDKLMDLHCRMGAVTPPTSFRGLEHEKDTDENIYKIAYGATNGSKFYELWTGQWSKHYSSQSEADFALIDILAFYSENREQVQRMFHLSELGKRQKAFREDYLNWMLNRCFDKMLPPIDVEHLQNKMREALALMPTVDLSKFERPCGNPTIHYDDNPDMDIPLPVGMMGEIAQFVYSQSMRPIPEVAISAALGFMAGICGRSYNISDMGLNLYIMLIALTAIGKESAIKGVNKLVNEIEKNGCPAVRDFVAPRIASEEGIIRYMSKGKPSIISFVGEIGIRLKQMSSPTAPTHLVGIRTFYLDAYNKSGHNDVMQGIVYSDAAKNTEVLRSPAFSMLGDSTPEKFYTGLHVGLITEGLLPRFTIIEHKGDRAVANDEHAGVRPNADLVARLTELAAHSLMLNSRHEVTQVACDAEAKAALIDYRDKCDAIMNADKSDLIGALWSRAHAKVLRIAALLAIGCNHLFPIVTLQMVKWAILVVNKDVNNMMSKFTAGDVGEGGDEGMQQMKVRNTIKDYYSGDWPSIQKYVGEGASNLYLNKVVPYTYIQRRLVGVTIFKNDKIGATKAIVRTLQSLCESGDLEELPKHISAKYGTTAKCYIVKHPTYFGLTQALS